jgi:hypothetical protein
MSGTTFLSRTFNTAMGLQASFPQLMDSLVVLVCDRAEPVYVSPTMAQQLSRNPRFIRDTLEELFPDGEPYGGGAQEYNVGGKRAQVMGLKELQPADITEKYPASVVDTLNVFIFDHELGHLLLKNGMTGDEHLNECAADAYATLRHIQRYGADTQFLRYYNRADMVIFGQSPAHCTDMVVKRVKELAESMDLSALSDAQTVRLAEEIANDYRVDARELHIMSTAYAGVAAAHMAKKPQEEIYKKVISVMAANCANPDSIFYVGRHFFRHPDRKAFLKDRAEKDPVWQEALEFVETGTMPASGVLRLTQESAQAQGKRPVLTHSY